MKPFDSWMSYHPPSFVLSSLSVTGLLSLVQSLVTVLYACAYSTSTYHRMHYQSKANNVIIYDVSSSVELIGTVQTCFLWSIHSIVWWFNGGDNVTVVAVCGVLYLFHVKD